VVAATNFADAAGDSVVTHDPSMMQKMQDELNAVAAKGEDAISDADGAKIEQHIANLGACRNGEFCVTYVRNLLTSPSASNTAKTAVVRAMHQWDPEKLPWDQLAKILEEAPSPQNQWLRRAASDLVGNYAPKVEAAKKIAIDGMNRSYKLDKLDRFSRLTDDEYVVADYYRGLMKDLNQPQIKRYVQNIEKRIVAKAKEEAEITSYVNGKLLMNKIDPIDHAPIQDLIHQMHNKGWKKTEIRQRVDKAVTGCGGV
jgi:hypothetical protein